jgi:copper chaperone NosL
MKGTNMPTTVIGRAFLVLVLTALALLLLAACGKRGPEPIAYGEENCDFCRMNIGDARFGAELVMQTGKVKKFDSVECLASYYLQEHASGKVRSVWVSDHGAPGEFVAADSASFLQGGDAHSPMGLRLMAFSSAAGARAAQARVGGELLAWDAVLELVARHGDAHGARPAPAAAL